ncbi:MAG: phosphoglycerate mutase family protein [bacterium]
MKSPGMESREVPPKILFKVTLMRHEKPYYKDEGHDLTPEGVERAVETGKQMREQGTVSDEDEIYLVHSPQPRAKGTLEFVAQGAGLEGKPMVSSNQLRKSDFLDMDAFLARVAELGHDQEKIAQDHYTHPMHAEGSVIVEPHAHKKERLYRAFEYLLKWFESHPAEGKTAHVIAVSHFEIITHLIDDVFGMENIGRYNAPSFGEAVQIEARPTAESNRVLLKVTFDGKTKDVYFDRAARSIVIDGQAAS